MWINTVVYRTLLSSWNEQITQLKEQIASLSSNVSALDGCIDELYTENRALRERLVQAEGDARSSQAMRDLLIVQNSQLQEERGQFLQKVLDPAFRPTIRVPKIQTMPTVTAPGVDFEDMGDAAAKMHGYSDDLPLGGGEHLELPITGLLGQVYDPASELGAELPRLGDTADSPPDM